MNNIVQREYNLLLKDTGISLTTSIQDAITAALTDEKLLLVYFHDPAISENNFVNILINTDINSLFKSNFVIHISSLEELHEEFYSLLHGEPDDVSNKLYVIGVQEDCIDHVSTICVGDMPEADILYELYTIHESFQKELVQKYEEAAGQCSKLYMQKFQLIIRNLHYKDISLKDALSVAMDQPVAYMKKILLIYMYKDGSNLSSHFNLFLASGEMKKYNQLFIPIFWDISNAQNHKALKAMCQLYFEQDLLENTISSDEGGVFFFLPDESIKEADINSVPRIFTSLTSSAMYDSNNFIETLEYIFSYFEATHEITVLNEIEAIDAYRSNSLNTFEDLIHRSSLHTIMEMCLQVPRKMLVLYFHTPMSKLQMSLPEIKDILIVNQVVIVPWTVTNSARNAVLSIALQRTFGLKKIEMMLKAQKTAMFIFVPIGSTLVLHSMLEEDASVSSIKSAYKTAHKFFFLESDLKDNENEDSGPAAYQQILCDQLQDRDFDCFQLDKNEGDALKKKIAFAYFGPPCDEKGYPKEQKKQIDSAYYKIVGEGSKRGEDNSMLYISFMRVCITPLPDDKHKKFEIDNKYQPSLDFSAFPLFGIRKCFDCRKDSTPCRLYIDHVGRTYQSWEDFIENNKYPKVMLIAPKNGRYSVDYRGKVQLEVCPSPACGIGVAILKGVDIGASVVGGIAGVVGIVTTTLFAVPVVPFVAIGAGLGVGVYSIVRSGMTIVERSRYGESLSLREAEARGAYLNILAGSLGFTSAGASFAMAYMARTGVNIGTTTRLVFNGITVANITAGGTAMGNSAYDIIVQWTEDGKPNTLALVQLASSVLFFGHAVYNAQFAGTIIENSQTTTIQEILDTLSSNRQRKTVMNLLNTTADQMGSTSSANAEVIRYIRNLDNVQEVVGVLTRDTKMLSRNGVKYSVDNGQILFNGVEMNVSDFGNMSKVQRHEMISSMSSDSIAPRRAGTPLRTGTKANVMKVENIFKNIQAITPLLSMAFDGGITGVEAVKNLMYKFSPYIQDMLLLIIEKWLVHIGINNADLYRSLTDIFPISQVPLIILEKLLQLYWIEEVRTNIPEGARDWTDYIVRLMEKAIMISTFSVRGLMLRLTTYCSKWIVEVMIDRRMEPNHESPRRPREIRHCDTCQGSFYKS